MRGSRKPSFANQASRAEGFESVVFCAANLADDADTTAAIVGQIVGAHYGMQAIADAWRTRMHRGPEIELTAHRLGQASSP